MPLRTYRAGVAKWAAKVGLKRNNDPKGILIRKEFDRFWSVWRIARFRLLKLSLTSEQTFGRRLPQLVGSISGTPTDQSATQVIMWLSCPLHRVATFSGTNRTTPETGTLHCLGPSLPPT